MFKAIDTNKSGTIDERELFRYFRKTGKSALVDESRHLFSEIDLNKDGEISLEELKTWLGMDHRAANEEKRAADQRRNSYDRAPSHTAAMKSMDSAVAYGSAWAKSGAECTKERMYSNGATMTQTRRTSQVLGGTNHRSYFNEVETDAVARSLKNREALRAKMKTLLGGPRMKKKLFGKAEAIPIKGFMRKLDREGMKFVYQDAKGMIKEMDTNGDGMIDKNELDVFLEASHAESHKQHEREEKMLAAMNEHGHYDLLTGKPVPHPTKRPLYKYHDKYNPSQKSDECAAEKLSRLSSPKHQSSTERYSPIKVSVVRGNKASRHAPIVPFVQTTAGATLNQHHPTTVYQLQKQGGMKDHANGNKQAWVLEQSLSQVDFQSHHSPSPFSCRNYQPGTSHLAASTTPAHRRGILVHDLYKKVGPRYAPRCHRSKNEPPARIRKQLKQKITGLTREYYNSRSSETIGGGRSADTMR
jgi:Ca2+-binding EF-hand superfamily protein